MKSVVTIGLDVHRNPFTLAAYESEPARQCALTKRRLQDNAAARVCTVEGGSCTPPVRDDGSLRPAQLQRFPARGLSCRSNSLRLAHDLRGSIMGKESALDTPGSR